MLFGLATGCAGNAGVGVAQQPCDVLEGPPQEALPEPTPDQALPRYFTLSVSSDGVTVGGRDLAADELRQALATGAADERNQGAALIVRSGAASERVQEIFAELAAAGFGHVVVSGLTKSRGERAVEREVAHQPEREEKPPEPTQEPAAPVAATIDVPEDVVVKRMGVHIGGGPNTEEAHDKFARPIEARLDEFAKCHWLAQPRNSNASFGVDLLIGRRGGRAKIQDYRTALQGKDFHVCMLNVFGTVEFPRVEQSTVLSYSLLFKPKKKE